MCCVVVMLFCVLLCCVIVFFFFFFFFFTFAISNTNTSTDMNSGSSGVGNKMNFLEACFSYVFGYGDPNKGYTSILQL